MDYSREHPRVSAALPVELVGDDGRTLHASTVDVSRAGVQIGCDRVVCAAVFPRGQPRSPAERPAVRVRLRLPRAEGEPEWIEARCRGVLFRRVGEDDFRLGLEFDALGPAHRARLDRLLDPPRG